MAETRSPGVTAVASNTPAPWTIQGGARSTARGAASIVGIEVQLALYRGYHVTDHPEHMVTVVTDSQGAFSWTIEDPRATVTLEVTPTQRAGCHVVAYGPYVCVRGDGPPPEIDLLAIALDVRVTGHVRDTRGVGIDGCRIVGSSGETRTDTRGAYELMVPSAGWGNVTALAPGFCAARADLENLESGGSTVLDFELRSGAAIEGRVLDGNGMPIEGARVAASGGQVETRSDSAGRYRLDMLDPDQDDQSLGAQADGFLNRTYSLRFANDSVGEGRLREYRHDFVLERGVVVSGQVVGPHAGPVAGAQIWIAERVGGWTYGAADTQADDLGRFVLPNVEPGALVIKAHKQGFSEGLAHIQVEVDTDLLDVLVQLGESRAVQGTVHDLEGAPLANVRVAARRDGAYLDQEGGRTDSAGRFEITGLPRGALELEAFGAGLTRETVRVPAGANEVAIILKRAGRLHGRVLDAASGAPIERFTVRLRWPDDRTLVPQASGFNSRWVDPGKTFDAADGSWSTDRHDELEQGAWASVEVVAPGYAPLTLAAVQVLPADDVVGLEHTLSRPAALEVSVVEVGSHTPLLHAGLRASVRRDVYDSDTRWNARTDNSGRAVFEDLPPGPIFFRVEREGVVDLLLGPYEVPVGTRRSVLTVEVPVGATLDVAVANHDGVALADRLVRLSPEDVSLSAGQRPVTATTNTEGRAQFEGVLAGRWQLALMELGGGVAATELLQNVTILPESTSTQVELRPRGHVLLRGTVESTVALGADARVSVIPRSGVGPVLVAPIRDGRFEVSGVSEGEQLVSVTYWSNAADRMLFGNSAIQIAPGTTEASVAVSMASN